MSERPTITDEKLRNFAEHPVVSSEWQAIQAIAAECLRLREEAKEHDQLFELQHERMVEATKLWQTCTGNGETHPDLGTLLTWLLEQIADGVAEQTRLGKQLEAAKAMSKAVTEWKGFQSETFRLNIDDFLVELKKRADKVVAARDIFDATLAHSEVAKSGRGEVCATCRGERWVPDWDAAADSGPMRLPCPACKPEATP